MSIYLSQGEFAQIVHQGGKNVIQQFVQKDGSCDMVCVNQIAQFAYSYHCILCLCLQLSGIVYFGPGVSELLLELHNTPPLDACTYIGLDNGAKPLSVS